MTVRSDRSYRFDRSAEEVWEAIGRVDDYRRWWPWLRRFEAVGLVPGDRWTCTVRPPVPYALRFTVTLDDVEPLTAVMATVSGDIGGTAELTLSPTSDGAGCSIRLVSALDPCGPALRTVTRAAPWLARFGHDWVLDTGLGQFHRRAL